LQQQEKFVFEVR